MHLERCRRPTEKIELRRASIPLGADEPESRCGQHLSIPARFHLRQDNFERRRPLTDRAPQLSHLPGKDLNFNNSLTLRTVEAVMFGENITASPLQIWT